MKICHIFLLLFIVPCVAFSFWNIRCPYQSEWRIRSSFVCNGTETKNYTCLYNAIKRSYEESCKFKPVLSGNGSQYVISVYPNSEPCRHHDRYQPFPLGSNVSHDCVFQKSTCREEGQTLFHHGSPKKDLTCRCNFQNGYGFINEIRSKCDCIPSKEDCSCYMKNNHCLPGHRLISDYICLHKDNKYHIQKCPEMGPEFSRKETPSSRQLSRKELTNIDLLNRRRELIVLTFLLVSCIMYAFSAVLIITTNKIPDFCSVDICPYNLEYTRDGGLLWISWSKPDKVPTIDILHYIIYHTYSERWTPLKVKEDKHYVFRDLLPKIYRFKVSVCLRNSIEGECTKEITFNPGLPEKPICRAPYGDNGNIVLLWDSPKDTLIRIENYLIEFSTDDWKTVEEISVNSNVLKHEIKDAIEGLTYRFSICSCSYSVRGPAQVLEAFPARHDTLKAVIKFESNGQTDSDLVKKDAVEVIKNVSNGNPIHTSLRDGSIIVDIIFISNEFNNEKLLYETLKNAFRKGMIVPYTIQFKNLWLKRLNVPSPPQLVNISRVSNGMLLSWKEPSSTFFKTKEYAVEYTEDDWISKHEVPVPKDNNSLFIPKGLPLSKIRVKIYTCICHSIRSSSSLEVSIDVEEHTPTMLRRSTRERQSTYQTTHAVSCLKTQTAETSSSNTDNTILYPREDMGFNVEVYQQSSVVSASAASEEITTQANITNLFSGHNAHKEENVYRQYLDVIHYDIHYNRRQKATKMIYIGMDTMIRLLHQSYRYDSIVLEKKFNKCISRSGQEAIPKYSKEEEDSIWLFNVLYTIGANAVYRKARQQLGIMSEILKTFQDDHTYYYMGSRTEGTDTPGEPCDIDVLICDKELFVFEDISNAKASYSLLIVRELSTPAGYVKLQLVSGGLPCTSERWTNLCHAFEMNFFKIDKTERIVFVGFTAFANQNFFAGVTVGKFPDQKTDNVISYRGHLWPTMANEWLHRHRLYGWPPKDTIEELKSLGFFVVRKGHPFSSEIDLEWRISFSLQERKLMFNLTDVQHTCYVILKMFNRDIIKLDCITTYHWKTCLFYAIENSDGNIWEKNHLYSCIQLCILQMIKWVKVGFCPNYFIPENNLFDGRLNSCDRLISEIILEKMLNLGFDCLLLVKKNNICDYVKSRKSLECFHRLQETSKQIYKEALFIANLSIINVVMDVFNHEILERSFWQANNETLIFINSLWHTVDNIQRRCDDITAEHTAREKKNSLYLLLPNIYTCLASNISAMAMENPNPRIRYFLFLGSFAYFMKGHLAGHLKFISVLYAAELFNDCEWWIDRLNEEHIKHNPSLCNCRFIINDVPLLHMNILKTSPENVSTCVSFLPTELRITPDAIKYEMFRFVGISLDESERIDKFGSWHYRAVVDSNIYFFLLKYLIKRRLGRVRACEDAKFNILKLITGLNVRHLDVALNVLAWIFFSEFNTSTALLCTTSSWWAMFLTDICYPMSEDNLKMKRKQNQYNAAKIHALVILYNTWFAEKPFRVHFCFQCFCKSDVKLQKCSRCKVSTYCDKQCQTRNWEIHKKACKVVRK